MRLVLSSVAVAALCASPAFAQSDRSANSETQVLMPEPAMLGAHLAKGVHAAGRQAGNSPQLVYHNGPVITTKTVVVPIFWGSGWSSPGDKIGGIQTFYAGVNGSSYLNTTSEYTQTGGAHVSITVDATANAKVDLSTAPRRAPQTSQILGEVCKLITNPVTNGYYPVYVDTKRGHAGYCAWHSWGSCNGVQMQFAFFFNLDGDPGCDPGSNVTGESQGLKALANVSGHELSEMVTDPQGTGWFDSSGAENADKCAWTFGASSVTFTNGSTWKIQGNWSNAAYPNGYANGGCIQTK